MREKVLQTLKNALPGIDFESSEYLIDDGILDSLGIVTIIAALSVEFNIMIPFEELEADNFNSVDRITALVESILSRKDNGGEAE